ncbi:MAG TPA: pseudouridine synthase [Rubrivivax sp.]|nr:pseudouridine synthase [Rubrivivax sp.]
MNPTDTETPEASSAAPADRLEAAAPEAGSTVAKRRRAPRKKAAEAEVGEAAAIAAEPSPPVTPVTPQAATPDEPQPPADVPASAAAPEALPDDAPPESNADGALREGSRRGRNRRRGRRGDGARDPEANPEGAAGDTGEGGAAAAVPAEARVHLPQPEVGEVFASVLSGAYDTEPAPEEGDSLPQVPPKRVLAPEPDAPKLQKVLAQAGIGSRRDIEQLVQEGRITVNGGPAHVGQRISFGDQLRIDGKPIKARIVPPPPRVLAYHKPAGEVVTHDDPQHRPTVFRRLPRLAQGKWQSVGRLDINTEGLLLFTNSGELANQLMHPRFGVEREYAVRVLGAVDEAERERLLAGVEIDGQACALKSIEDGGGEGANRWYRVVITEGRNREVRKLFEAVGHAVSRLIRVRYGSVVLPRGLRRGLWVDLDEADVWTLRRIARPAARSPAAGGADAEPAPGRADGERRGRRGGRKGRNERRRDAAERAPRFEGLPPGERAESGPIPNPLQQTYDKRAIQQERTRRAEYSEDGPIPNPLQQTYDKRAIQQERTRRAEYSEDGPIPNPLQQTYDKRFVQKGGGLSLGRGAGGKKKPSSAGQPDPMQTAVGYIGADAFLRKAGGSGRGGRPGRGKPGGGGSGGGGRGGGGRGR